MISWLLLSRLSLYYHSSRTVVAIAFSRTTTRRNGSFILNEYGCDWRRLVRRRRWDENRWNSRLFLERRKTLSQSLATQNEGGTTERFYSPLDENYYFEIIFDWKCPEGQCVGVVMLPSSQQHQQRKEKRVQILSSRWWLCQKEEEIEQHSCFYFHPDEIDYVTHRIPLNSSRRQFFLLGRLALRQALNSVIKRSEEIRNFACLKDFYGRPQVPQGYLGSISHKDRIGVGLVSQQRQRQTNDSGCSSSIGVDLEHVNATKKSIARKILTHHERLSLGQLETVTADEEVLLRFSLKESLYKALHPWIFPLMMAGQKRMVNFSELEVQPRDDGTVQVSFLFQGDPSLAVVQAHWTKIKYMDQEFFLTMAKIEWKKSPDSCL